MVPMSLEQVAALAQIAGSVGVVLSLVFVGLQVKQNTAALYRNEHNATMAQWTVIRMGIAQNRDIAEFMTTGLTGDSALDAPDQLRMEQFLSEQLWAAFHIWDREQRGVFAKGTFEWSAGRYIVPLLATPRGSAWWRSVKNAGFFPPYVAVVDALLARPIAMHGVDSEAGLRATASNDSLPS
jgi:hypothetical protein